MYLLIKDNLVVESSTLPIVAAQDGDYFASQTRHHYDPRPSSGVVVIEADFPEESFCTYQMVDGKPALINPLVPESVTMRQAARALLDADLLDDVEALVATLPRAYQIDWERASVVERTNPLVEIVRQQKSMTDAQIDNLFITAATL